MVKKIIISLKTGLLVCLLVLCTDVSMACTCTMTPIKEHIKTTKTIVVGKVVKLLDTEEERKDYYFSDSNRSYRILLEIETVYKGRLKKSQVIELGSTFSNCDIYYKSEEKYLLFIEKKGKRYFMRHCSYNEQLDNATDNIKNIENELNKR